jgi:hypothetical protein
MVAFQASCQPADLKLEKYLVYFLKFRFEFDYFFDLKVLKFLNHVEIHFSLMLFKNYLFKIFLNSKNQDVAPNFKYLKSHFQQKSAIHLSFVAMNDKLSFHSEY